MFTREIIDGMDKSQVKAAKGLGSLLNDDDKTMLDARWAALTAPPAPTPFPKQAELTDAYAQWKAWSETIKALHTEARAGNHTFTNGDGETVKPAKTRKAPVTTSGGVQIVIGDNTYTKWVEAAIGEGLIPESERKVSTNRRPQVMESTAGKVVLTGITPEEYAAAFPIPEGCKWEYIMAE